MKYFCGRTKKKAHLLVREGENGEGKKEKGKSDAYADTPTVKGRGLFPLVSEWVKKRGGKRRKKKGMLVTHLLQCIPKAGNI